VVTFQYEGELTSEQQLTDKIKQQLEGASLHAVKFDNPQRNMVLKAERRA
jgi:hypothetical protein